MKVLGLTLAQATEAMNELELYPEETAVFAGGCGHGHEALIRALLERGGVVKTVLAAYTPPILTDGRWEATQERVRAEHERRFKSHQACHCS
jgi:hypothetical protein